MPGPWVDESCDGGFLHFFPVSLVTVQMPCVVELYKTHDLVEEYYFLHDLGAGCGGLRTSSLGGRHHDLKCEIRKYNN